METMFKNLPSLKRLSPRLSTMAGGFAGFMLAAALVQIAGASGEPGAAVPAARAQENRSSLTVNPAVTTRDAEWVDDARQRAVPVRLYLPAAASSSARCRLEQTI